VLVHATTLDISNRGIILLGASGAGKSDLALRLIDEGALLVADDQTWVELDGGALKARAPVPIQGLIEVRGIGILPAATKSATRLSLAVTLVQAVTDRMPEPASWSFPDGGARIPLIELAPFEPSATAKLRVALAAVPIP
jgi:serine kinase of HPr protein (carbohydrate metabolism regulator)